MSTSTSTRPLPQTSMSFPRLDSPSPEPLSRTRSSTLSLKNSASPDPSFVTTAVTASPDKDDSDVFFAGSEDVVESPVTPTHQLHPPQGFDDLPIEIRSLTERFLESLSAKVHPTPLSIQSLAELFQDFYRKAEKPISTHIAALSSKLSRENSSTNVSRKKASGKGEQQMLTASEISYRRKARKLLEQKKVALEEAVERAVCEKVYLKIWHHRSSDDEEMDQKLRSRIAALSLVGIGLKELLISGSEDIPDDVRRKTIEQEDQIKASLAPARTSIQEMTNEQYPLGKLHHLVSAHKSIVETLSNFFPSTSSADEILPTIIYTLITSPPETVNVISDLHFIQRFRTSSKVDGEAAYCLVNLEAAISFLETVELPTLRADESLQGPDKNGSVPPTPRKAVTPMQLGIAPVQDPLQSEQSPPPDGEFQAKKPPAITNRSSRSLSELIQAQTNKLEAASDSFRGAVLDSADQAVDAINSTIENSFRFLFGRIREEHQTVSDGTTEVPVPKTLEDARKLVSTPPPPEDDASTGSPPQTDNGSPTHESQPNGIRAIDIPSSNRVIDLVGGRRLRDRSVDSIRSAGSGKRVSFSAPIADPLSEKPLPPIATTENVPPPLASPGNGAVESMRSLGNSLNPLNQFAKISLFGRSVAAPLPSPTATPPLSTASSATVQGRPVTPVETKVLTIAEEMKKMQAPSKKFVDCKDVKDLRVGDMEELLVEYQKLAGAIKKMQQC